MTATTTRKTSAQKQSTDELTRRTLERCAVEAADASGNRLTSAKRYTVTFALYIRASWPQPAVTDGSWTPPPVTPVQ